MPFEPAALAFSQQLDGIFPRYPADMIDVVRVAGGIVKLSARCVFVRNRRVNGRPADVTERAVLDPEETF
jgi:hypothetical protein